jgi:hypothetical protein
MPNDTLTVVQCQTIPRPLERGHLYVSKEYGIAQCLCPCGDERCIDSMSLKPQWADGWEYAEDDQGRVTLSPSILNPCGTHYFLRNNEVQHC